jgi:hypothetical protein
VIEVPKFVEKVVDNIVTIPERYILKEKTTEVMPLSKTEVVHDKFGVAIRHDRPVEMLREVAVKHVDHIEKPLIYTQHNQVPVNQVIERSNAI